MKLYAEVVSGASSNSNLVLAPFSVHSVLTMTSIGTAGKTRDELQNVLEVEDEENVAEGKCSLFERLASLA
jgi:serine protease inhibitor